MRSRGHASAVPYLIGSDDSDCDDDVEHTVMNFDYGVVDQIVDTIVDRFSPEKVIIFGSVASRTADSDSDVDILVVMDTEDRWVRRSIPLKRALFGILVAKDILVVTPEEFQRWRDDEHSFIHDILAEGYVAYEKSGQDGEGVESELMRGGRTASGVPSSSPNRDRGPS